MELSMKITFLKSFRFCGAIYITGQTSPSKRFPTIPFNDHQTSSLESTGNISVEVLKVVKALKTASKPTTEGDKVVS
jgi:hypothetical protein